MQYKKLEKTVLEETSKFKEFYLWLQSNMPHSFFEDVNAEIITLIIHNLMSLHTQEYFSQIRLSHFGIVLCLDSPGADIKALKHYRMVGIKNYRAYVSKETPPIPGMESKLRIAVIFFTEAIETGRETVSPEKMEEIFSLIKERNPDVNRDEIEEIISGINSPFLRALSSRRLVLALDMFYRARTRDHCQYEVRYNKDWETEGRSSIQIVLAWRNIPKQDFLYRLARMVHRHGLVMVKVNATYVYPYSKQNVLIMALGIHGANGKAAWDVADIPDFLRELVTMKNFGDFDLIDDTFVSPGLIRGNLGNLLRSMKVFIHQALVHADRHQYAFSAVDEALCRHPEITVKITEAFEHKFHPDRISLDEYKETHREFHNMVNRLDTGHPNNDTRRRNILRQGMNFVDYCLKTNFYRNNKSGFGFRLDPQYLEQVPYDRAALFPEIPYAIFFIKGMHFFGFHIRFRDLARGGLRTVFTRKLEHMEVERNTTFQECYNLAYTQQKKNKDIAEGGAKGVILLKPYERLKNETEILEKELKNSDFKSEEVAAKLQEFQEEQNLEFLYQAQRSFISSLLTLVNCEDSGTLKSKHIVDYWKRPEYIYLGPDENMHNSMIQWIADLSEKYAYKSAGSFISSKPTYGINHKQYGVTSLGVNVYMHELLKHLGINPEEDEFTIKITGGPDGDVAGNQINNLHRFYRKTAKLLALTDGSGTIYDPEGLDLDILVELFDQGKPIRFYPPERLADGGILLDRTTRRDHTAFMQQTLCWKKKNGIAVEEWVSGSDMNALYRDNVHMRKTDIFIPAGGRPRTLHEQNWESFLDSRDNPTSRGIVEGANLYLTSEARQQLEEKGVIVIRDSSANKGGVICSSFEVLSGLTLGKEKFLELKEQLVQEILDKLQHYALQEAQLLLRTHGMKGTALTIISEQLSEKINQFTDELMVYLETLPPLDLNPNNPLIKCFLAYCLPTLRDQFQNELLQKVPDQHKKAIIASHIAAQVVYHKGLDWTPSIVDILPLIWSDSAYFFEESI